MKNYEGKTFVYNGHTIKIMTVAEDDSATIKVGTQFQNITKEDLSVIVQNGEETGEACNMEEGCDSCGS